MKLFKEKDKVWHLGGVFMFHRHTPEYMARMEKFLVSTFHGLEFRDLQIPSEGEIAEFLGAPLYCSHPLNDEDAIFYIDGKREVYTHLIPFTPHHPDSKFSYRCRKVDRYGLIYAVDIQADLKNLTPDDVRAINLWWNSFRLWYSIIDSFLALTDPDGGKTYFSKALYDEHDYEYYLELTRRANFAKSCVFSGKNS